MTPSPPARSGRPSGASNPTATLSDQLHDPARRKLADYYGTADLDDLIGNHLAKYKARPPDALGWLADRDGVSVQQLLPHGTPQTVRDEVRRLMDEVGRDGGFIISPSHDMPGDIPTENMIALIETVREG